MNNFEIEKLLNSSDFEFLKNIVFANYNGNKPELSKIIEEICNNNGILFEDSEKFLQEIRDHLRQKIANQVGTSDNKITFPSLTKNEIKKAENDRTILLETFKRFGNDNFVFDDVNSTYVDYKIVYDELSKCSPQKIAYIMNHIEESRKKLVAYHAQEMALIPSPSTKEMHKKLFEFYQNNLHDSALPILFKSTEIGNHVTSTLIERNIPNSVYVDLNKLQFISNLLESIRMGYYDKGYIFDGSRLVSYQFGKIPSIVLNPKNSEIVANLDKFDMSTSYLNQTRLAFDESTAKFLVESEKYPISKHVISDDEKDITIELSSNNKFFNISPTDLVFPIYLKYKQYNKDSNTFTVSLYVFLDDDINHGTQLYRIDKVNQMFRGRPTPHKQLGGEVLETYQHIHEYNLLNQLLNNDRKRGHFDVSQNLITMFAIDKEILELIFDNKTNCPKMKDFELTQSIINNFNQRGE